MSRTFIQSILISSSVAAGVSIPVRSLAEELPTVVVSMTRFEQSSITTASNISVISKDDIEKSGAATVADVLRKHSGLMVSDLFGDGNKVTIGIRGFAATANANTLVLVDGRRLNNTDIASPDIHSIPVADIERIEIVNGSSGVLYGDQAVGGIVNIITKQAGDKQNQVDLSVGSFDKTEISGRFSGAITDDLAYKVVVEDRSSDNYRDHNAKDFQQLSGRMVYKYSQGSVFAEAQYVDDKLETPGPLFQSDLDTDRTQSLADFDGDFSNLKSNVARLGVKQQISDQWSLEAELTNRNTDGVFRLSYLGMPTTSDGLQDREVTEFTPRLVGVLPYEGKEIIVTAGVDVINSDYRLSTHLGDQENDQSMSAFYVQGVIPVIQGAGELILGVRRAEVENQLKDSYTFPTGQDIDDALTVRELGFKYQLSDDLRLFARIEENYRFAKVDEYTNPVTYPSLVILDTQTGVSYEAGVSWLFAKGRLEISTFRLDLENELSYDPSSYANVNIDSTSRQGITVSGEANITPEAMLAMSVTSLDANIESGSFEGKDVPYVADLQANASLNYSVTEDVALYTELLYTGERVVSGDFNNDLDKLPAYTLLNLGGSYRQKNVTYRLRINNLLDKTYSEYATTAYNPYPTLDTAYYPSAKRNLMLTANIRF